MKNKHGYMDQLPIHYSKYLVLNMKHPKNMFLLHPNRERIEDTDQWGGGFVTDLTHELYLHIYINIIKIPNTNGKSARH